MIAPRLMASVWKKIRPTKASLKTLRRKIRVYSAAERLACIGARHSRNAPAVRVPLDADPSVFWSPLLDSRHEASPRHRAFPSDCFDSHDLLGQLCDDKGIYGNEWESGGRHGDSIPMNTDCLNRHKKTRNKGPRWPVQRALDGAILAPNHSVRLDNAMRSTDTAVAFTGW